jgi:hypothetical protein
MILVTGVADVGKCAQRLYIEGAAALRMKKTESVF